MEDLVIARRIAEEEIENIAKLAADTEAFDKHKALGDHAWLDLVHGGRKGVYGFTARKRREAQLLGYAQISTGNETWALELVIHPMARNTDDGVSRELLRQSLEEISRNGGGHVHVWLPHHNPEIIESLRAAGFSQGRRLVQMRRSLPVETDLAPETIDTRAFQVGLDEQEWLRVNNLAFSNHPEQGGWTLETLAKRQAESWFDPEGFLLHFEEDRLVGFCWTKIHTESAPALGEIYVIGVDPTYAGKGIGRRICLAGLNYLGSKGVPIATLYVDSENTSAIAMYEHLGFHSDHVDTAYVTDVPPSHEPHS